MERILFIGGLIPNDDEIKDNTVDFMNAAADAFQTQFIEGIGLNGYEVEVISAPFIGSYPFNFKKAYYHAKSYADGYKYVSFNNIWGLRNFSRYKSLVKAIQRFDFSSVEKVIIYSVHTPFARIAKYIKKKVPGISICLITPDLPEYMNLRKDQSLIYRVAKKLDCKNFYNLTEYFDCFCFVSAYQSEKVNKLDKPQTVIEGMAQNVEITYTPLFNIPKRIVYTGTLNKQFGIMNLVKAVEEMEGIELILCGSGDALPEIEKINNKRIKYLGILNREETRQLQLSANVLVNPRTNEGDYTKYSFPSKTMEYLSTGRPVVCYKLDGIPEDYDNHLIYAKEETPQSLKDVLVEVLQLSENELESIFLKNTRFLQETKNTQFMVRKIIKMLDRI